VFRLLCLNNVTKTDIYSERVENPFLCFPASYCQNLDLLDLRINLIAENNAFVRAFNAVIATMKFTLNLNKKEFSMSKTVSKFALVAGLVLAMVFTFSCSSDDGDGGDTPSSSSVGQPLSSGGAEQNNSSSSGGGDGGGGYTGSYGSVAYGGKTYRTVKIGSQTWFAENLNYVVAGSKCFGEGGEVVDWDNFIIKTLSNAEVQSNCDKYGRLYDWPTAMALPSSCNSNSCSSQIQPKHIGICPSGWHIPSYDDWVVLMDYVGSYETAGTKLKATSGWNWNDYEDKSGNGTDQYGFSALPGGIGSSDGDFFDVGNDGNWWCSSEINRDYACYWYPKDDEYSYVIDYDKSYLLSVRCLQD